jgi:hypothetical protein
MQRIDLPLVAEKPATGNLSHASERAVDRSSIRETGDGDGKIKPEEGVEWRDV